MSIKLSPHQIREISVAAMASPKAVKRFLEGKLVKDLTRVRVEHAARQLGISLTSDDGANE
jgi:hypothetical protein